MSAPFYLSGRFALPDADAAHWRERLLAYAEEVRAEPGCLRFELLHPADAPSEVVTFEIFDGEAGFEAHSQAAHTKAMVAALHAAGIKPALTFLTPMKEVARHDV